MPVATGRSVGQFSRQIGHRRQIGYRPLRKPLWSSRESFFIDVALFVFGAAGAYTVDIVGALPVSELLVFPMLPVLLLARGKRAFSREYLWFYVSTGAWFLGTLIADAYNGVGAFNRAKGMARVVFFILDFMALAIILNNKTRRMIIFAVSIAGLMAIGSWRFMPATEIVWKFGFAESVAIVALLVSSYYYARRRYWVCLLISLVLCGLSLLFGFRSQLGVVLVSAVFILPLSKQAPNGLSGTRSKQDKFRILVLLALAAGAAYLANAVVKYAAESGFFDESTQAKFVTQASGDYGVLFGGRPETLVAIQAIRDSPFVGHGSFPYGEKYVELKQDIMYEHGYTDSDDPEVIDYPVIPTHSHLTMAWVEGGIFGGICWIYILILAVRGILRLNTLRPHLAPLYCYLLVAFLWDILYSPFGSINRILAAFYILVSYHILKTPETRDLPIVPKKVELKQRRRFTPLAGTAAL
jgi:hypothetical protein